MNNDILIIADSLIEPPSEVLAFRTITMFCHDDLDMDILFQTTQAMKDLYYHFMKPKGLMDYIAYILNEQEKENGIHLDIVSIYPNTIVIQSIRYENIISLLDRVKIRTRK